MNTQVKIAIISTVGVIVAAIITAILGPTIVKSFTPIAPSSPTPIQTPTTLIQTPTQQIPPLHATYSGSLVNNGTDFTLSFTGLNEFKDGSFQTTGGNIGYCYATFSGKVSPTGSITFTGQQLAGGPYNCVAMTADFNGQVDADGSHLSGTWQAQNTSPPQSGSWNLA
jgi:hypothetical protein